MIGLQSEQGTGKILQGYDVFSSLWVLKIRVLKTWLESGQEYCHSRKKSDQPSKERLFDVDWFLPELVRFKWLFIVAFLMSLILHGIALHQ